MRKFEATVSHLAKKLIYLVARYPAGIALLADFLFFLRLIGLKLNLNFGWCYKIGEYLTTFESRINVLIVID